MRAWICRCAYPTPDSLHLVVIVHCRLDPRAEPALHDVGEARHEPHDRFALRLRERREHEVREIGDVALGMLRPNPDTQPGVVARADRLLDALETVVSARTPVRAQSVA